MHARISHRWPLVRPGGVLLGDDYKSAGALARIIFTSSFDLTPRHASLDVPGVKRAFHEMASRYGVRIEAYPAKAIVRKPL